MQAFLSGSTIITADMLNPLTEYVNSNVSVIVPAGIAVMCTLIGVKLVPRIIHYFI